MMNISETMWCGEIRNYIDQEHYLITGMDLYKIL